MILGKSSHPAKLQSSQVFSGDKISFIRMFSTLNEMESAPMKYSYGLLKVLENMLYTSENAKHFMYFYIQSTKLS